jgi:hypothetical protein
MRFSVTRNVARLKMPIYDRADGAIINVTIPHLDGKLTAGFGLKVCDLRSADTRHLALCPIQSSARGKEWAAPCGAFCIENQDGNAAHFSPRAVLQYIFVW